VRPTHWTFLIVWGGTSAIATASACGLDATGLRATEAGAPFGSAGDETGDGSAPLNASDGSPGRDALAKDTGSDIAVTSDATAPPDAGAKPDAAADAIASDTASMDVATGDSPSDAAFDASPSDVGVDSVDSTGGGTDDSQSDAANCDFSGTWATRLVIDVSWVPQGIMGVILAPGSGQIKQWLLSTRTVSGSMTTDSAAVCGIALPDFMGTQIAGGEKYGIEFPDAMFDSGNLPTFTLSGALAGSGPGGTFTTSSTAVLLGLTLSNPTTAPWPATITTEVDSDQDGKPGVTAYASQDAGYSNIQVDPFGNRGDRVYLAIRQVTSVTGNVLDCDSMAGTVNIPQIADSSGAPKYAIDSHVIGCRLVGDAGDCSAGQTTFVDTTQPVFSPSGATTFASVRVGDGATCATARQRLP
jgi:hypothetical protein